LLKNFGCSSYIFRSDDQAFGQHNTNFGHHNQKFGYHQIHLVATTKNFGCLPQPENLVATSKEFSFYIIKRGKKAI